MFGCIAAYVENNIVFALRNKRDGLLITEYRSPPRNSIMGDGLARSGGDAGAALSILVEARSALLQSRVAKAMRGRMMSLQTLLNMGLRPLGDFPLSILIARPGAPAAAGLSAALIGAYSIYLASTSKRSWQAPAVDRVPR